MANKPHKVEEPAIFDIASKSVKKPTTEAGIRTVNLEDVRKANAKLMQVHRKVLQKLAQ